LGEKGWSGLDSTFSAMFLHQGKVGLKKEESRCPRPIPNRTAPEGSQGQLLFRVLRPVLREGEEITLSVHETSQACRWLPRRAAEERKKPGAVLRFVFKQNRAGKMTTCGVARVQTPSTITRSGKTRRIAGGGISNLNTTKLYRELQHGGGGTQRKDARLRRFKKGGPKPRKLR